MAPTATQALELGTSPVWHSSTSAGSKNRGMNDSANDIVWLQMVLYLTTPAAAKSVHFGASARTTPIRSSPDSPLCSPLWGVLAPDSPPPPFPPGPAASGSTRTRTSPRPARCTNPIIKRHDTSLAQRTVVWHPELRGGAILYLTI